MRGVGIKNGHSLIYLEAKYKSPPRPSTCPSVYNVYAFNTSDKNTFSYQGGNRLLAYTEHHTTRPTFNYGSAHYKSPDGISRYGTTDRSFYDYNNPTIPSSLALLSVNTTADTFVQLIVFDNLLYTIVNITFNDQIVPTNLTTNWYSMNKLIGCPQQLCLDGQLDAADYNGQDVVLYNGDWSWHVRSLSNVQRVSRPSKRSKSSNKSLLAIVTTSTQVRLEVYRNAVTLIDRNGVSVGSVMMTI